MADFAELGIGVDSRALKRGQKDLEEFSRASQRTEKTTERVGRNMSATFSKIGLAAGALGGILATAFGGRAIMSTIAGFDKSMAQVQAITRATGADMEALRATAARLGATTEFSASQAADGLKFLGMAGFTAQQSMAAIPAVLDLATAASIGLAEAADTASNIMSGFGIEAQNAASVADVLAAASSRSNTSVSQLGSAMSTVAPISASLGIGLADTAAAIGVMSDAGIQGERAGTALRGVLASLAGPTKQASDALAEMGLSAADVNPQMYSMETIFGRLQKAGMSTAQAMAIFGREVSTGAIVLADASVRLGEFGRELGNVSGEAGRMAGIMRDTLDGDLDTLRSTVEGLIITIGDAGLTQVLRSIVQAITDVIRAVGDFISRATQIASVIASRVSPALVGMNGVLTEVARYSDIAVVAISGFFAPVILAGIAKLTVALGVGLVGAIRAVTAAMMANPIGLLVAALATAAYAVYQFRDTISEVIGTDVINLAKRAGNIIIGSFVAAFEDIKFVWSNFGNMMGAAVIGGVNLAIAAINKLIQGAASGIDGLIGLIRSIPGLGDTPMIGEAFGIKEIPNPYAGRLYAATAARNAAVNAALNRDYIGEISGLFGGGQASQTTALAASAGVTLARAVNTGADDDLTGGGGKLDAGRQYIQQIIERIGLLGKETEVEQLLGQMSVGSLTFRTQSEYEYAMQLAKTIDEMEEQLKLSEDFEQLMKELFPKEESARQFAVQLSMINQAFENGWIDAERYAESVELLEQKFADTSGAMGQFAIQAARNIQNQLGDGLYNILKGDFDNIASSFGDMVMRMAADAAAANLAGALFGNYDKTGQIGGLLGSIGSAIAGSFSGGWSDAQAQSFMGSYASGGYTGPGGKYEPAGVVHKGEVVFSQRDVARAGGVARVEAMRMRGYSDGGVVGGSGATGSAPVSVNLTNNGTPQEVQSAQASFTPDGIVVNVVLKDLRRKGPISQQLKQMGVMA